MLVNTQELGADNTTDLRIWTKAVTPLAPECLSNAYVNRLTGGEHETIDQAVIDEVVRTNEILAHNFHGLRIATTVFMCIYLHMFNLFFLIRCQFNYRARPVNEVRDTRNCFKGFWQLIGIIVLSL